MATSEMRGFVFSLIFIILLAGVLSSMPTAFQGAGSTPETVVPIDPSLVTGFAESNTYNGNSSYFTGGQYAYELGSKNWLAVTDGSKYALAKKMLTLGFWLGQLDSCKFTSPDGVDRGTELALTEITADAEDGQVRYSMIFSVSGDSAGAFICYWNTTTYDNATQADAADELYFVHGVGFDTSATNNIGALLVGLLTLSIPDVPPLVNLLLATPIWACIIYVLWYVIKEMIPFV